MGSIDEALADFPQPEHDALQRVIDIERRVASHAIDGVRCGVPALTVAGKPFIEVNASARHLSLSRARWFLALKGHDPVHRQAPLPEALIERLVAARLAEITSP